MINKTYFQSLLEATACIFTECGSRVLIKRLIVVVIVEVPLALLDTLFSVLDDHSLFDNNIAIVFKSLRAFYSRAEILR